MKRFIIGIFILSLFLDFSEISVYGAEKLQVGFPSLATALSPAWVASKKGFWQKNGLDIELIYLSSTGVTVPSLLSGSTQILLGSDTESAIAMIKGADLIRLGATTNSLGSSLVTQQNISSFGQLKGKIIGIGSGGLSSLEVRLSQLLLDNGVDPKDDVKFLSIGGGPPARVAALQKGLIIAAMITPPYDFVAARAGLKIFSKVDVPLMAGGINTTRAFAQKSRGTLLRFLKGYMEGIHYLLTHKEETVRIFSDYLGNRDEEVLGHFYGEISGRVERGLRPDPKSVRFLLDVVGRRYPQARSVSETDYSDLSLLEEIHRSGFLEQIDR